MIRECVLILAITALCGSTAQADSPESGTFDINGSSGLTFAPIPWVSPNSSSCIYLWPFASNDKYAGSGSNYNLAQVTFSAGSFTVADYGQETGDLGIRVANQTGSTQTFEASILTLNFIGSGSFDVYLPEFTFKANENENNIFFWVAQSGATYYANSLKGAGEPNMFATVAMSGDEYLARVPEPATVLLLGLGGILLRRKIRNQK
jgi:hypothetical protein